jgi:prevent-host-death family protein
LALIDQVAEEKDEIVITKRGKPVARLVPLEDPREHEERLRAARRRKARQLVSDEELNQRTGARNAYSYRKHWTALPAWCAKEGFCELPAAPQTLALLLSARADEGRKVATLSLALSAISQAYSIRKPRPSSARCQRRYPRAEHWKVPASAPWLASAIERVQFSRVHRFSVADSP